MEQQLRLEVQASLLDFIDNLMGQNSISAPMMEDALNKALVHVKDMVIKEYLIAMQQAVENNDAQQEEE